MLVADVIGYCDRLASLWFGSNTGSLIESEDHRGSQVIVEVEDMPELLFLPRIEHSFSRLQKAGISQRLNLGARFSSGRAPCRKQQHFFVIPADRGLPTPPTELTLTQQQQNSADLVIQISNVDFRVYRLREHYC